MKYGPFLEMEAGFLGAVYLGACDVPRQQVRGKLYAVKAALDTIGKRLYGAGLGQPGRTFHQEMAVRQQCNDESLNEMGLADDLAAEPGFETPYFRACHACSCFEC
jgi:hypothetical protein